jgi:hypothetical protein
LAAATAGLIVGFPEKVQTELDALLVQSEAQELMLTTFVSDIADRVHSFELLAKLAGLDARWS